MHLPVSSARHFFSIDIIFRAYEYNKQWEVHVEIANNKANELPGPIAIEPLKKKHKLLLRYKFHVSTY